MSFSVSEDVCFKILIFSGESPVVMRKKEANVDHETIT